MRCLTHVQYVVVKPHDKCVIFLQLLLGLVFVVWNGSLECRKNPSTKKFSPIILTVSRSIMMSETQDMQKKKGFKCSKA